eukprot:5626742-Amphidinium_carterae.2
MLLAFGVCNPTGPWVGHIVLSGTIHLWCGSHFSLAIYGHLQDQCVCGTGEDWPHPDTIDLLHLVHNRCAIHLWRFSSICLCRGSMEVRIMPGTEDLAGYGAPQV